MKYIFILDVTNKQQLKKSEVSTPKNKTLEVCMLVKNGWQIYRKGSNNWKVETGRQIVFLEKKKVKYGVACNRYIWYREEERWNFGWGSGVRGR